MNKEAIDIETLIYSIKVTNQYFLNQAQKQVNIALTLQNWVIGFYIFEYEQHGNDRATYGQKLFKEIASKLAKGGIPIRERHLYICKDFYQGYPFFLRTVYAKSYFSDFEDDTILRTLSANSATAETPINESKTISHNIDPDILLSKLSFSHFIELLKAETGLKRCFYEVEAIKNSWSVRNLQRAMNSMLFERTGLSKDKKVISNEIKGEIMKPEDLIRDPYILEFLALEEKISYSETDLEHAIINHLQTFLLEMGRGFCFEARQKRITFDNTHYHIDMVFYHRILKCHVLIDLKLGEFSHADAGQMNVYLNYYKDNEMLEEDNPPVGIILCAGKNESLVKYATAGLAQQVFVSKYLINLPSEKELKRIIEEEQNKLC
jgi:predicted nuclease of restriction endonuclease-like (RecB) superfamily